MHSEYKGRIEHELKLFFEKKKNEAKIVSQELYDAVSRLEEYTLRGGKRIRAILIVVGYLASGGKKLDEVIKLSISAELLHSFLLIHDDIMDEDMLRRNGPSMHASYCGLFDKKTSENIAIDIGDISFCYAIEPLINADLDGKRKMIALRELIKIVRQTCYGQLLDVVGETKDVDSNYISKIHEYKTARYTISGPLKLGAMLAGSDKKLLNQFDDFGMKLGKAFQLKDDILGVFGDEEELGKPIGSDLVQGKKTLLIVKADSDYINRKIGSKLSINEIGEIRKIIVDSGSLSCSEKLIKELLLDAQTELKKMRIRKKEKEFLLGLIDYLEKRKK